MSYVRPVDMDTTLNYMFKTLKVGSEKKLENFNGKRKIYVYKDKNYMNKITVKLSDATCTFIRYMRNLGTTDEPNLKTATLAFTAPKENGRVIVYFNEPGDSKKGVLLNVFRDGFNPYKKNFANLMEMRQDDYFKLLLYRLTGKDFSSDGIGNVIARLDAKVEKDKFIRSKE